MFATGSDQRCAINTKNVKQNVLSSSETLIKRIYAKKTIANLKNISGGSHARDSMCRLNGVSMS